MDVERKVRERYSQGAGERQESLCCPVSYDAGLLSLLPEEIVEKDYGCGDPSRYVQEGDVVLDLGSGGGKICYIAAQLTGSNGAVIGVDINDDMLALARKYQRQMTEVLGGDRVRFLKGYIQDLALDLDALDEYLAGNPVRSQHDYQELRTWEAHQRSTRALIADDSIDLVISNCVLNLVADTDKQQLIREIHRVLKPGGRVAISDIVSDKPVPEEMKTDAQLWSGCISGAFQEVEFLQFFSESGFYGVRYDKWEEQPWQTVEGIEFRSVTLTAVKAAPGEHHCSGDMLIYRGPFAEVSDDAGNRYPRGMRVPVTGITHRTLTGPAYTDSFIDPVARATQAAASCCAPVAVAGMQSGTEKDAGPGGGACC